jgi:hypothetical protein
MYGQNQHGSHGRVGFFNIYFNPGVCAVELVYAIFGILWVGLALASFVTFIAVPVALVQANGRSDGETDSRPGSVPGWIILSIVGFCIWAFVCAALFGFGFSHSGLGSSGALGNLLLFAGPALYLYSGRRQIELVNAWRPESSGKPT